MTEPSPRISDMIRSLISRNDRYGREILADAINLYTKATQGRLEQAWTEKDVSNLFFITSILLSVYEGTEELAEGSATGQNPNRDPSDYQNTFRPKSEPEVLRPSTGAPRRI